MASETASLPVNGNYAPHQGFGGLDQQNSYSYNPSTNQSTTNYQAPPSSSNSTSTAPTAAAAQSDIPKDEVGWYFVEQYYTTLSRSPEKLYLFYNKRSQFVSGQETDKEQVCLGQRAINTRIKELDFQDCKVRVTNVDSQASDSNIVIQVIGEMTNKSQAPRKFTQTFVLATQTNGYFVLNDIFRYLIDEEEDVEAGAAPAETVRDEEVQQEPAAEAGFQEPPPTPPAELEVETKTLTSSTDPVAIEHDAQEVDREIEEKVLSGQAVAEQEVAAPTVNGVAEAEPADKSTDITTAEAIAAPVASPLPDSAQLAAAQPEAPQEPVPTPSPPKQTPPPPAPAAAAKPSAPMSWAARAAGAARVVATPVAPAAPSSSTASQQARATPPSTKTSTPPVPAPAPGINATAATATATTLTAVPAEESSTVDTREGDEWTAVGGNHNRAQARQQAQMPQQQQNPGPVTRGIVRNVHEGVADEELRGVLAGFGELVYFDINRARVSSNSPVGHPSPC